jgi:hypothetical protein
MTIKLFMERNATLPIISVIIEEIANAVIKGLFGVLGTVYGASSIVLITAFFIVFTNLF